MSCYFGGDTDDLEDGAKQILHIIMTCYPGHNVKVWGYTSGVFHITHLDFEQIGGNWGMALKGQQFFSASHMQSEVVRKFGEWLERANLKRGAANGDEVTRVEGVPEKNHANLPQQKKEINVDALIEAGRQYAHENQLELRETPRPQALREMGNG